LSTAWFAEAAPVLTPFDLAQGGNVSHHEPEPGGWADALSNDLRGRAVAAPRAEGLRLVAEAVATADAALIAADRRQPDAFGWAALASLDCAVAEACFEEAAGWPPHLRPDTVMAGLEDVADTAALLACARRLLAATHDATVALASAASTSHEAELLSDAAAALSRPLTAVRS
jgi:hypothetical protein